MASDDRSIEVALHNPISSDDDAFNTEDARIHFGPFKSPERKIITTMKEGDSSFPQPVSSPREIIVTEIATEEASEGNGNDIEVDGESEAEDFADASRVKELIGDLGDALQSSEKDDDEMEMNPFSSNNDEGDDGEYRVYIML